jgi:hypothetical protein
LPEKQITHALQGHVKHQGLPVSGVSVRVFSAYSFALGGTMRSEPIAEATTGSKGEYSFSLPTGNYVVEFVPSATTRFLKERANEVELYNNVTCNIALTTGTLLIGSVKTNSGKRLTDSEVVALGIEPTPYSATSPISADGTFTLVLPKGKFHVASRYHAHPKEEGDEQNGSSTFPYISTQVQVVNLVVDDELDLQLPELFRFKGEVEDIFGQPVSNATIKFHPIVTSDQLVVRELSLNAQCETDNDGTFEIWLEQGVYELEITPAPSATHFGLKETNIRVQSEINRKFILEEGHKLRGDVVFENEPLGSCFVRVQDVSGTKEFVAKTDDDGHFVLGVPRGNYKMVVVAHPKSAPTVTIDGAEHAGIAPWAKIISVEGDMQVSVDLRSGTALKGRVRDDSGQARAGMKISVFPDNKEKLNAETANWNLAIAHCVTDADGHYSIFLSPGSYLTVIHKDFANASKIEVGTEPVTLDITWHGWCQIKFEVVGDDGAKVPRCKMEYHPYGEREDDLAESANLPRGYVLTDEDGRCQVTIPQGVYTFKFHPPASGSYEPKDIRQLSISADLSRKLVLNLKNSG